MPRRKEATRAKRLNEQVLNSAGSARGIAKKIDFDLDGAMQHYEFWIPGDLYISCEHWQCNGAPAEILQM